MNAIKTSALGLVAGILLSGPIALAVVAIVAPQPAWTDAACFAAAYHPIQLLPYIGGFVLIGSCVALVASLHAIAPPRMRARANIALALTAAFAALILLNYILQTTFVPSLAASYRSEHAPLIEALTMSNPRSLAWALEMWGYAAFGVATWAIAGVFGSTRLQRATAAALCVNGAASVVGAIATTATPSWALTTAGLIAFAAWNALMVAIGVLAFLVARRGDLREPRLHDGA